MSMITPAIFHSIFGQDRCHKKGGWFIGDLEFHCFMSLVRFVRPEVMVELGVFHGATSKAVLDEMPNLKRYMGVDIPFGSKTALPSQSNETPQRPGEEALGDDRFELVITPAGTTPRLPIADFVYIDGDHSFDGVMRDTKEAFRVIRPGGCIMWHDYHTTMCDVTRAIDLLNQIGEDRIINIESTRLCFTFAGTTLKGALEGANLKKWIA